MRRASVELGAHDARRALFHLGQQPRQLRDVVGPQDHVDLRHALDQRFALLLGHATGDQDHELRPLALTQRQPSHLAAQLLLGLLAHAARVEENEVCVVQARRFGVAAFTQ